MEILLVISFFVIITPLGLYPIYVLVKSKNIVNLNVINRDNSNMKDVCLVLTVYKESEELERKLLEISKYDYDLSRIHVIIGCDGFEHELTKKYPYKTTLCHFERCGKTVAQNKIVQEFKKWYDFFCFSDVNSQWNNDSLSILCNTMFANPKIGYLSGALILRNGTDAIKSESYYWNVDLMLRTYESHFGCAVGGNGAIYAVRTSCYRDFPPLISHDGYMGAHAVTNGFESRYVDEAVAFERSPENIWKEYHRKVRMNRGQPFKKYFIIQKFNFFKFPRFALFNFLHKYLKYQYYWAFLYIWIYPFFNGISFPLYTLINGLVIAVLVYLHRTRHFSWASGILNLLLAVMAQWHALFKTFTFRSSATWNPNVQSSR